MGEGVRVMGEGVRVMGEGSPEDLAGSRRVSGWSGGRKWVWLRVDRGN